MRTPRFPGLDLQFVLHLKSLIGWCYQCYRLSDHPDAHQYTPTHHSSPRFDAHCRQCCYLPISRTLQEGPHRVDRGLSPFQRNPDKCGRLQLIRGSRGAQGCALISFRNEHGISAHACIAIRFLSRDQTQHNLRCFELGFESVRRHLRLPILGRSPLSRDKRLLQRKANARRSTVAGMRFGRSTSPLFILFPALQNGLLVLGRAGRNHSSDSFVPSWTAIGSRSISCVGRTPQEITKIKDPFFAYAVQVPWSQETRPGTPCQAI
ncbi:hypothetical protein CALVIDRAFT_395869 [Calocera viscosa TUFC12733]|uniref:Uncharacterized protein n=1 Tax=Calocera viscosa (strain TUFC12733) TaxID=1330018 RepID=A0A167GAH1_CALVF|nr:hypothetical protein CALVIDRAFT_395869 [Calocera viscosa TUFC12733]